MSFIQLVLSAYGIKRGGTKPSMDDLKDSTGDVCAKMDDKEACESKLVGHALEDDALHRDGIRWLWDHIDLLRATRADTAHSRWKMARNAIRAVPGWMWYPIIVLMGVVFVFCLMMLAIVVRSFKNPIIMVKLAVLGTFSFVVLLAFLFLPV